MNRIIIIVLLITSFNVFSQTQSEMNSEAYADLKKSDKELNNVYQKILVEYKTDSRFVGNLKKSQRLWIKFRDAELEMKYPNYREPYYGSVHPMCRANYLKQLTEERIRTLQIWLMGIEEGDMCSGSVKMNH